MNIYEALRGLRTAAVADKEALSAVPGASHAALTHALALLRQVRVLARLEMPSLALQALTSRHTNLSWPLRQVRVLAPPGRPLPVAHPIGSRCVQGEPLRVAVERSFPLGCFYDRTRHGKVGGIIVPQVASSFELLLPAPLPRASGASSGKKGSDAGAPVSLPMRDLTAEQRRVGAAVAADLALGRGVCLFGPKVTPHTHTHTPTRTHLLTHAP